MKVMGPLYSNISVYHKLSTLSVISFGTCTVFPLTYEILGKLTPRSGGKISNFGV